MPKAIPVEEVLRRPIVTEQSTRLAEQGQYVFEVAPGANKPQIRQAVQQAFSVEVLAVNTMNVRGKEKRYGRRVGRQRDWKKAIVTVAPGQRIEIFEGV